MIFELRRCMLRPSKSLWILPVIVAVSPAVAIADDPADQDIAIDAALQKQALRERLLKGKISQLNAAMESQLNVAREDAAAARKQFNATLQHRVAILDRVCGLTDAQRQKIQLAGRRDNKLLLDRVNEIEEIRTQWKLVKDDADEVEALMLKESEPLKYRFLSFTIDDSLSGKILLQVLTAEQRAKYQPVRAILGAGGLVQTRQDGVREVLEIGLRGIVSPDDALAHSNELANVQVLLLEGSGVTDAGLAPLIGLTDLERLQLHNTSVTDAGLRHLKGMTKLEWLTLDSTQVTDAGLADLKGLAKLKCLSLSNTQVTDVGLAQLKDMTSLRRLQLRNTLVTDAALAQLKRLTELESLGLSRTQVTNAGVAELKRALPDLDVER